MRRSVARCRFVPSRVWVWCEEEEVEDVRRWDSVSRRWRARSLAVLSLSEGSVGVGAVRAAAAAAAAVAKEGGRADWEVLV